MRLYKKSIYFLIIGFLLSLITFGQEIVVPNQRDIWKSRADAVTFTLVEEAGKTTPFKRALIYAQLGDLWWKFSPEQSNVWFEKTVDLLFFNTPDNSKSEADTCFQTVSETLTIISNRNQKQTNRLVKLLSENNEISEKNKNTNADTLIEYALSIVKENPDKAAELGLLSFKTGQPNNFYELYWQLRRYAPNLADNFFNFIISQALISPNPQIMANLKTAVFPESVLPNAPTEILSSNSTKTESLNFFADYIIQQQAKFSPESISNCKSEALSIAPLKNYFTKLLPQKANRVQQAIEICLANDKQIGKLATVNLKNGRDIDELLKFADESGDDLNSRVYYLSRAISLANDQKKYKLATEILESMNEDEREIDRNFWEELRYTVASGLSYQQFQEQDLQGAIRTLEAVPADNREFAKIGFALKFSPKDISAREFILERIREAQVELTKSAKPFTDKSSFWFQLIKIYSNYSMTAESAEIFNEIVRDFNKSFSDDKIENKPFISSEIIISVISADLLQMQDNSLFESANLIKDEKSRIQINFGFLNIALKKYEMLKAKNVETLNKNPN